MLRQPRGAGRGYLGTPWPAPTGYGRRHDLSQMTVAWRGDIDPKTGTPRLPVAPGRADRMLYLLHEMAHADA
ncbi:hypothetical protein ACFU98_37830 [Streptomyces sp. NPDC057575]|uniref:hypothetical protein n=1 Tax=unclassified Streptomyces TaxID=2593676 RepID=UPI0036AFD406